MKEKKKRILLVGEFSELSTGYSTMGKRILTHLHNSDKYEVRELAAYLSPHDPRQFNVPWKCYPVLPDQNNQNEVNTYNSNPEFQFGSWKFEETCLDFFPHCILEFRDKWMMSFEEVSPFRPCYNWIIMPAVDSVPQHPEWLASYSTADAVLSYSDWGVDVLNKEGGGKIKTIGAAPAGVELDIFKPVSNKKEHKRRFGIEENTLIIGYVNRNQQRKLFPDLFEAFTDFLKQAHPSLADRTFLYCHTAHPDIGWNIPKLLKTLGISHKVLFTYLCSQCGLVFPSFYQDVRCFCPKCKSVNVTFPNTQRGVDRPTLAAIYNLFDVYVQYAVFEAQGIGQCEAAACGVPVMSVDFSAMKEIVHKLKGYPIEVERFIHEPETGRIRAFPKNSDLINKLINFLQLPESMRAKKGFETRRLCETHYNWENSLMMWEKAIDSVPERSWFNPPRIHSPAQQIPTPQQLNDEQFINWACAEVWGRPEMAGSYYALKMLRDLQWGVTTPQPGGLIFNDLSTLGIKPNYQEYNREKVVQQLTQICLNNNKWEQLRWQKISARGLDVN